MTDYFTQNYAYCKGYLSLAKDTTAFYL